MFISYHLFAGIKLKFPAIVWDDPHQVLLTLAAAVESDMGGSSGAVSSVFRIHYSFDLHPFISMNKPRIELI